MKNSVNKAIAITLVALILSISLVLKASANEFGYIVSIDDKNSADLHYIKTQCTETLQESILLNTGLVMDIEKIFKGNNVFFEFRMNDMNYYVEKKIVERKKNGKLAYRKITRKERKELSEG